MSVHDVHPAPSRRPIPRPRTAGSDDAAEALPADEGRGTEAPPEPWWPAAGTRPSTEYWDVATASWRSRGRRPRPVTGD